MPSIRAGEYEALPEKVSLVVAQAGQTPDLYFPGFREHAGGWHSPFTPRGADDISGHGRFQLGKEMPSLGEWHVLLGGGSPQALLSPPQLAKPEWSPDFGPPTFVPRWGATVTGARTFLIAYNINLLCTKELAHRIALNIREQGRGPDQVPQEHGHARSMPACPHISWAVP